MTTSEVPLVCTEFESKLSGYLENELSPAERTAMDAHVLRCPSCAALLRDVRAVVHDASSLPPLSPSRDLWSGIAARLDASVTSISGRAAHVAATRTVRTFSLRQFAAAAVALITISSGVTYFLARAHSASATTVAANLTDTIGATVPAVLPITASTEPASTEPASAESASAKSASVTPAATRAASYSSGSADVIYEREIKSMRRIVDERLGDLDSTTVVEIERNLAIIDKAIADSRAALAKDPHSGFLSGQLDRALETKLSTLRKVALL